MRISIFVIVLLVYLLANFYVFHRVWVAMPPNMILRTVLIIFAVVVATSFFLVAALGQSIPTPVTSVLYAIGTSWMFILLYFILVFLFQDIVLLANKAFNFIPSKVISHFSKENMVGLLFTIGFIALLMIGGYLKYTWKERVHLALQINKPITSDSTKTRLRAVVVSDLHLGYTIGGRELKKWVSLINAENPDIILIAGDLMDNHLRPLEEAGLDEILRELKAPKGVYACLGNHEYMDSSNFKQTFSFFEKSGIKLLKDEYLEVDSAFYIVGRDDRSNSRRKELSQLVADLDKSKPIILLDHQPYNLEVAEENGIDLQVSGHTHKGQVWPISMITGMLYELQHGYIKKGSTHIYVSSGIGIWGGKFRIGTQSEFVVIDIN